MKEILELLFIGAIGALLGYAREGDLRGACGGAGIAMVLAIFFGLTGRPEQDGEL